MWNIPRDTYLIMVLYAHTEGIDEYCKKDALLKVLVLN